MSASDQGIALWTRRTVYSDTNRIVVLLHCIQYDNRTTRNSDNAGCRACCLAVYNTTTTQREIVTMRVVAVLSEKGGAGKTTATVHLAVAAQMAGVDTVIIDLDPQASAADWADRRGSDPEAAAVPPARLAKLLDDLRANGAQLAIIDTGRDSHNAGYTAAQAADLILIPCRPGGFDFRALSRTLDLCRLAGKRPYVVLNGMRPGAARAEADTREALASHDCELCPVTIHDRAAYRTASIGTKTSQETEPGSAAALEIIELYNWLSAQVGLSTTRQPDKTTR